MNEELLIPFLPNEYATADLGNVSRTQRLCWFAETMCVKPSESFPRAAGDDAGAEAMYRFLGSPHFGYNDILAPHLEQTAERIVSTGRVLLLHDTTECAFSGDSRQGLGRLTGKKDGFLAHATLAVARETQRPLGLINLDCWARTTPPRSKTATGKNRCAFDYAKLDDRESLRWFEAVQNSSERIVGAQDVVHVMDREADTFSLLSQMLRDEHKFIVRLRHNRKVGAEVVFGTSDHVRDLLKIAPLVVKREVTLSRRGANPAPRGRMAHGPRQQRIASLEIRALHIELERPRYLAADSAPKWVRAQVVHITEPNPPDNTEPVDWILLTSEPIDSEEKVLSIVDAYRTRWLIEEYFKALKTGCALEKRQLESFETLTKALAVFAPIAWQLLLVRNLSRTEPTAPATDVLTHTQIQVLRIFRPKSKLSDNPTVRDVLLAIASLGGHLKNNGDPGWQVLGRGFQDLLMLEKGWCAATAATATANKT